MYNFKSFGVYEGISEKMSTNGFNRVLEIDLDKARASEEEGICPTTFGRYIEICYTIGVKLDYNL
jgi:hypothetical protein